MKSRKKGGAPMIRIGLFSKLGMVTVKTLRHYDETGLLIPAQVDEENGYRYYRTAQLFRLQEIVALRQMDFSIPQIADILEGRNVPGLFAARKAALESELSITANRLFRLGNYIAERQGGQQMSYQAIIKEIPACIVFSTRQNIPNYEALFELMPTIGAKVAEANPGIKCAEPDYNFNIFHDPEYKEQDIDIEICQAVTSFGKDGDGIIFKQLPAVTVASVLHKGGYDSLGAAFAYAVKWVGENGYAIAGEIRESFIDGVWNKDSEEDWLTEIQVPVKKEM
jgi:DNA-binding transcriptional MerR regulator